MSAAEPKSICVYFQSGYCRNGSKCRFSHVGYNGERKNPDWHYPHGFYYYDSICKFVEKGQKCPYGWNCWYYHPERDQPTIKDRKPKKKGKKEKNFPTDKATGPIESENNVECPLPVTTTDKAAVEFISRSRENKSAEATVNIFQAKVDSPSRRPLTCINAPQFIFDVVSLSEEDLKKLRTKEVEFLKIKYKGCRVTENTNEIVVEIPFLPSDPDWPFDVKEVRMNVKLPIAYPKQVMTVDFSENSLIPSLLSVHLTLECNKWLSTRHEIESDKRQCEMVVRSFLRWLDRSIRDLFVQGLRKVRMRQQAEAAGISCVLPSSDNEPVLQRVTIHEDQQSDHSQSDASTNGEIDETFIKADNAGSNIQSLTIPRQTEVSVRRVDLTSSVGTLKASRIQLILMCSRCKNRESEVFAVKAGQTTRIKCSKCHGELSFAFEPCVIHSNQGGNIICWLKLDGCIAFDLVLPMAEFYANCLECSCDNPVGGLNFGQQLTSWCRKCHSKLGILLDGIRITNVPSASSTVKVSDKNIVTKPIEKLKRVVKDPAIREGQPLPEFGACKHYKKSFRWFRFPCCGKTYPCDLCHEEHEDHEMKIANRVICGFCCSEQGFAGNKPCAKCKSSLTKTNTAYWEGGKGCRDTTKMKRSEKQKYAGHNKTVAKTVEQEKVKKKTKNPQAESH